MAESKPTPEPWGRIGTYDPAMALQVAQMFNDFNELWPGGFGGRVPYDERRVRDWLDDTSALADLIAFDADEKPVGYCGVYPHWRDSHAAYVTVLGVVPRVKGKGYGKHLLLRAVEIARAHGLRRLDLHTWSGNLNAVPLYKKIGLFWVPDTSVYMQNYLPGLFQMPLAREWFDRHPDWYSAFQRELVQAPDKYTVDGMEQYEYVFAVGEDRLVGQVDRYGWGFYGLRCILDGEELAVKASLRAHEVRMGIPNEMTILIENGTSEDKTVALSVEPFKGLSWTEPFPLTIQVPAGEQRAVTRAFVVDRSAEVYKEEASEVIRSRLILGEQVLDLVTGAKIQPAIELSATGRYHVAPPERTTQVYLDLTNHAKQPLSGRVDLFVKGLDGSRQTFPFSLEPEQVSGIAVPVALPDGDRSDVLTLNAVATIEHDGTSHTMPTYHFPLVTDRPGLVTVVEAADDRHIHLLTDLLDADIDLEGGGLYLGRRSLPGPHRWINVEVGPPYGLNPDRTLRYNYELQREGETATLILHAISRKVPDLEIRKYIRVRPGGREFEHWVELTNLQTGSPMTTGLRVRTGGSGGLSFNPFDSRACVYVPLQGRILAVDPMLPVANEHLIPQEPEQWTETWTAAQSIADRTLEAVFWKPEQVTKIKVDSGMVHEIEIGSAVQGPGERRELLHLWYGVNYTSPTEVRNRWSQLVGRIEIPYSEQRYGLPAVPAIDARLAGGSLVAAGTARYTLELRFATAYPFAGELHLNLPSGWRGGFVTPGGPAPSIATPEPIPDGPVPVEIELAVPAAAAGTLAAARLHLTGEFEIDLDLPLLVAGPGKVVVRQEQVADKPVMAVSNGALSFSVLGEVGGNLIRLQDAQGRPFLYDHFPEIKPFVFMDNHIGGLTPSVFHPHGEDPFAKPEPVWVEQVEEGPWAGVRAAWTAYESQKLRGQAFTVTYLVLPGCPLVRVRLAHDNPTPRRVRWMGLLMLDLALGGEIGGLTYAVPGAAHPWVRHPTPMVPFMSSPHPTAPWAWAGKGEQSLIAVSPAGSHGMAAAFDLGQMTAMILAGEVETAPHGTSAIEFALALNQDRDSGPAWIQALGR